MSYEKTGNVNKGGVYQNITTGSAHILDAGKTGAAHNRNIPAAAATHPGTDATNTATWTTAEGVTELTINAIGNVGGALQNDEKYIAVINAPTAAIAKAWLEDAGTLSQDVVYEMGNITESLIIRRTTPITRLDVLPLNVAMRLVVGAV